MAVSKSDLSKDDAFNFFSAHNLTSVEHVANEVREQLPALNDVLPDGGIIELAELTIKIKQYDREIQRMTQTEYAESVSPVIGILRGV